jgi:hypothetical protein
MNNNKKDDNSSGIKRRRTVGWRWPPEEEEKERAEAEGDEILIKYSPFSTNANKILCNMYEIPRFILVITWPHQTMIPCFLRGHVGAYRTATHAFEVLKSRNLRTALEFEVGGMFDDYQVLEKWPASSGGENSADLKATAYFRDTAKEKDGMIGAVARLAANVDPARAKAVWNLQVGPRVWNKEESCKIWELILKAKFPLTSLQTRFLLSTMSFYILHENVNCTSSSKACGKVEIVEEGGGNVRVNVVGHNLDGKYLMTLRKEIREEFAYLAERGLVDKPLFLPSPCCDTTMEAQELFDALTQTLV